MPSSYKRSRSRRARRSVKKSLKKIRSKDKFERCVLKVKDKQSPACRRGIIKSCKYNPYAICHYSLGY